MDETGPVLLPGKSHGWRSLVGCSRRGREESDMTERLHFHFSLLCIGEGNGNPLQCSCLENPRDGVAQSRTRLKWLSSSKLKVLRFVYIGFLILNSLSLVIRGPFYLWMPGEYLSLFHSRELFPTFRELEKRVRVSSLCWPLLKWLWKWSESESRSVLSLRSHDYIVHGILQARILEWVAFPFSRGSSWPRNQTRVCCIAGGFFTYWAIREVTLAHDKILSYLSSHLMFSHKQVWGSLGLSAWSFHFFSVPESEQNQNLFIFNLLLLGKIEGKRRGDRGWDGWMTSSAQWAWVWTNSGRQWRTGNPGMLQSMGCQRLIHDWVTEQQNLLLTEIFLSKASLKLFILYWKMLVAKSCPTLCDPMDCSPPGSSVHGILQERILEWVASILEYSQLTMLW